ncbi:hypothetical protein, partial [Aneurinibacillus aneurinilyticus]|uniref:hypothetical protein n=1 Tax=Aneurinibacillus aneurinilyticus TaxID=1391 RepID=UPI003526BFAD
YKAEMKSEKELHKDALEGKSDLDLKNINFEVLDDKGKPIDDAIVKKYFTAQKLKEIQNDENTTTSTYVIYAAADHDLKDSASNAGLNFTQTVWAWVDVQKVGGVDTWAKGTRYEAKWQLHDGANFTLKSGVFEAKAQGRSKSTGKTVSYSSPSPFSIPTWDSTYVKTPTSWDYVKIDDQFGFAGAHISTSYTVRSTTSTIHSNVVVGSVPISWQ